MQRRVREATFHARIRAHQRVVSAGETLSALQAQFED